MDRLARHPDNSAVRRHCSLVLLLGLAGFADPVLAEPLTQALSFEDPRGDDHGPGSYIYPTRPAYVRGAYDLRRVRITPGKLALEIEVVFGAKVERPTEQARRTAAIELQLANGIYVQHVDLYIQTGSAGGSGHVEGLPGRNIRFAPSDAWNKAIILTPQPQLLRQTIEAWPAARDVIIPSGVRAIGFRVKASVPYAELGGPPQRDWAYAIAVSGAVWDNQFFIADTKTGAYRMNALTMPVVAVPDRRRFGGGDMDGWCPNVIDVVVPQGLRQEDVLADYSASERRLATIPMLRSQP